MADLNSIAERMHRERKDNPRRRPAEDDAPSMYPEAEETEEVNAPTPVYDDGDDDEDDGIIDDDNVDVGVSEVDAEMEDIEDMVDDDEDEDGDDAVLLAESRVANQATPFELEDDEIYHHMERMPYEEASKYFDEIRQKAGMYRMQMIHQHNFGNDLKGADVLTKAHLGEICEDYVVRYLKDHPDTLAIVVNKEDADKLEFTAEEREKMSKVRSIRLKVVEESEMKQIKIKKMDKRRKVSYIDNLNNGISSYAVPLPLMHDYITFNGTQLVQLFQTVRFPDDTFADNLSKRAKLLYDQMGNGRWYKKTDEHGKSILPYSEFLNTFMFFDIPMGLYAILVASSMEDVQTPITCSECNQPYDWTYNVKKLLQQDSIPDIYQEIINDILAHPDDVEYLKDMHERLNKTTVLRFENTGNIYHVNQPSIARVLAIYRSRDMDDQVTAYIAAFAMFLDKMYLYDSISEDYLEIDEDEVDTLFQALKKIPNDEMKALVEYVKTFPYQPSFKLISQCTHCGRTMTNEISVDDLVLLSARDSLMEIQQ